MQPDDRRSRTPSHHQAEIAPYLLVGGMDTVFDDTCGNLLNLHQD